MIQNCDGVLAKMGPTPRKGDFGDRQIEERMIDCEGFKEMMMGERCTYN